MYTEMSIENEKLFEELDVYNWDTDSEFQAGLSAILGPNPSPSQIHDLTIRARCFYYSRKTKQKIDFDAYKAHLSAKNPETAPPQSANEQAATPLSPPTEQNPSYPTSFADIVALINSGAPIPGIKDIPPTVLSDKATQPTVSRRRKPWEKDEEPIIPEGEGTFGSDRDRIILQEEAQA